MKPRQAGNDCSCFKRSHMNALHPPQASQRKGQCFKTSTKHCQLFYLKESPACLCFLMFQEDRTSFSGIDLCLSGLMSPSAPIKAYLSLSLRVLRRWHRQSHLNTHINHKSQKVLAIQMVWISNWAHGHVGARRGRWVTSHSKENGILRKPLLWLASVYQKPIWWMKGNFYALWSFRIPCHDKRAIVLHSLIKNTELFI